MKITTNPGICFLSSFEYPSSCEKHISMRLTLNLDGLPVIFSIMAALHDKHVALHKIFESLLLNIPCHIVIVIVDKWTLHGALWPIYDVLCSHKVASSIFVH